MASISEEDVARGSGSPIDRLKSELVARNVAKVSPGRAAQNRAASRIEVLGMLPITGNVMAGRDAYDMGMSAVEDFRRGEYVEALKKKILSKLFGTSAMLGLPTSRAAGQVAKGASSRANVFVPAVEDAPTELAREMRQEGLRPHEAFAETGRIISPAGQILEEIPDTGLKVDYSKITPSAFGPLSDFVSHPQLAEQFPDLLQHPTRISAVGVDGKPLRGAMTLKDDMFLLPAAEGGLEPDVAKLLQYQIGRQTGMPPAVRHDVASVRGELADTASKAAGARYSEPTDVDALAAYLQRIKAVRDQMDVAQQAGKHPVDVQRLFSDRSAGNVTAARARQRQGYSPLELATRYPYGGRPGSPGEFGGILPLIPKDLTRTETSEFLRAWRALGSGREPQKFADGGRVKRVAATARRRLAVGAISGKTDGRADKLPVSLPAGAYVIPADIVSALGEGNTAAGFKKLDARFPAGKRRVARRDGGAVEAIVSDGEFVIPPEEIRKLGGGNLDRGHAALDLFVKATRQAHIARLQRIPDPNK